MSAAPTDYPPAVLEEAEQAMVAASSGLEYPSADLAGAQAYTDVLARYTLSQRLAADALTDTEPPPVDEDARELAQAYERGIREGRAQAIADGAGYLRLRGWCVDAARLEEHEREHRAGPVCAKCESAKQGAASS